MIHHIHIAKAGADAFIDVDDATIDEVNFAQVIVEGLKAVLNAKMTKVGAVTKLQGDELATAHAKAMEIAQKNLADLQAGKYRFPGQAKAKPESREVQNEANRLAKEIIRDQIVAQGFKISHIPAKDVTAAAKDLLKMRPELLEQAKANIAERNKVPTSGIDLAALGINVGEATAKAEALKATRSAKAKENLSAKQAGGVKGRATKSKPVQDAFLSGIAGKAGAGVSPHHTAH